MEKWAEKINSQVDTHLEKSREKDLRFFRIDEFKRNVARVEEFSSNCSFCNKTKIDIVEASETIAEAVNVPGKSRREFDRLITRLSKHMRKEHGFYPPYYYSYTYSFLGIAFGLAIGLILYNLIPLHGEVFLASAVSLGIITSYIAGTRRDNKIRKEKRLM
jgi:hypothetical protein